MAQPVHVVEMSPAEREQAFVTCRELAEEFRVAGPRHDAENSLEKLYRDARSGRCTR